MVNFQVLTKSPSDDDNRPYVQYHRIVIFDEELVKIAEQSITKGCLVSVIGKVQTRKYFDKAARTSKNITEIVVQENDGQLRLLMKPPENETEQENTAKD